MNKITAPLLGIFILLTNLFVWALVPFTLPFAKWDKRRAVSGRASFHD